MSQNLGNAVDALKYLNSTKLFDLNEPSRLIKGRPKSKRDPRKKLSCTGCNQDCNGFSNSIENDKAIKKVSQHGRKRLLNENIPIFFCSVPTCCFSSNVKHFFEEHYDLCYKTYQRKQDSKKESTAISPNDSTTDNNCSDMKVYKEGCSENVTQECNEEIITNKDLHDSVELAKLCNSTLSNDAGNGDKNRNAGSIKIEGTTCKTYHLPRIAKDKIGCIKCGIMFSRRKQLKRHLKKCPSHESNISQQMDNLTDEGFLCVKNKPLDIKPSYACPVCNKMFKLKIGLKKHTEKAHFKTTNAWNGKEFGTVVQISLAPKAITSDKITKNCGNFIVDDEFEPANLLHEENNDGVSYKADSKKEEFMSSNSKIGNLGQSRNSNSAFSHDPTHEPPVDILPPKKKQLKSKAYNNYVKKILKSTAPKIFKDKIRKKGCKSQKEKAGNILPCCNVTGDEKFIPMECKKKMAKQQEQNDLDVNKTKPITNLDDIEHDLSSSLQSLSITPEHKLSKRNNSDRPSSLDSRKIGRHRNGEEIRILHDEFIYRTVMAEILKNEARIIFDKVILSF